MKKGFLLFSALSMLAMSARVNAETAAASTASVAAPSASKALAAVDIRPSWTTQTGEFHSENSLMGGYQFTDKLSSTVVYNFNNNIQTPGQTLGLNLETVDFSLRFKASNLYQESNTGIAISYEQRMYLPLAEAARSKGMIAVSRNYLKASKSFGEIYKLTLMELPILHLYERAGSISQTGAAAANPVFENRVYLINDFQLTKAVSLSLPVFFHVTWYRDFQAGAKNNNGSSYFFYTYPEVTYAINDNLAVAAAYYSDNLILGDLSNTDLSAGLEKGVFQVSLQASL